MTETAILCVLALNYSNPNLVSSTKVIHGKPLPVPESAQFKTTGTSYSTMITMDPSGETRSDGKFKVIIKVSTKASHKDGERTVDTYKTVQIPALASLKLSGPDQYYQFGGFNEESHAPLSHEDSYFNLSRISGLKIKDLFQTYRGTNFALGAAIAGFGGSYGRGNSGAKVWMGFPSGLITAHSDLGGPSLPVGLRFQKFELTLAIDEAELDHTSVEAKYYQSAYKSGSNSHPGDAWAEWTESHKLTEILEDKAAD